MAIGPPLPCIGGSVKGLRARGGITVDLAWKDGELSYAKLTPDHTGPVSVRLGGRTVEFKGEACQAIQIKGGLMEDQTDLR